MEKYHILDTLFEAIAIVDKKAKIVYSNHFFSTLFKASPRVIRKLETVFELFESHTPFPKDLFEKSLQGGDYVSEEIDLMSTEGDSPCHVVVKTTKLEDGNVLISFNDISIEKKLYDKYRLQLEELKKSHAQIVQADKLATIGELSAGISHEISNPLTIATGSMEILEEVLDSDMENKDEVVRTCIADVVESHARINSIILNMKSFLHSQTEEDEREYCDLEKVILDSIKFVTPSYNDHKVLLKSTFDEKDLVGLVNKVKIEQVIVNLLSNALDALVDAKVDSPEVQVEVSKDRDSNILKIRIKDNGPGVPDENKEQIFNAFFTTKDVGEGTGLGLAIASKIIEAHQGSLMIEDTDQGASFLIQLPFIEILSYTQNEMLQRARDVQDEDTLKVMVLDNEVQVLNILNKICADEGIVFMGSVNGLDALKILEDLSVDLIITDYLMPQMDGSEFSKRARELGVKSPILYMSAASNQDAFQRDKEKFNIAGMILKPFTKEEVIKAIYGALGIERNG
ncbi:MAG: response regulator [Deltaproteobacteria bacterium]|nr:MAG: response regulator [Deltaproteobacteria bacterium]TNF30903.1 MAG: response regulator [Deltaproteobacteria bacterium]